MIKKSEWEIFHSANPTYKLAFVDVVLPHWSHIKADRRPASIHCGVLSYGAISIEEAEKFRDALTQAIDRAKTLKLERPVRVKEPPENG